MPPQRHCTQFVGGRLDRFEVRIERRLDVDDEIAAFGHVHDHVGAQCAVLRSHVHLLGEVAVLDHAGKLGKPAQRQLAPLAAHFRPAQCVDQRPRLLLQRLLSDRHRLDRAAEAAERLGALFLDALYLLLGLVQRVADRRDERLDGLLTLHQHGGGVLVVLAQVLARQLQEHFIVRAHRRAGHVVEARAQPLDGLVESSLPLAIDLLVGLDLRAHDRELQVQRFALAPAAPGRREDADQHTDEQADERRGDDGGAHWRASPSSAGRRRCIM